MKSLVVVAGMVGALLVGVADAHAIAWGGGQQAAVSASVQSDSTQGPNTSVPEPSALYAVGSALALLGGAGWYIRRRK
jgi:LPXTG-motif cell wall-anchored protein